MFANRHYVQTFENTAEINFYELPDVRRNPNVREFLSFWCATQRTSTQERLFQG